MKYTALLTLAFISTVTNAQVTVYDIQLGISYFTPQYLTKFDNQLYTIANDGTHGYELWGIDSAKGAFMVADIASGKKGILGAVLDGSTEETPGRGVSKGYGQMAVTYVEAEKKDVLFFMADD